MNTEEKYKKLLGSINLIEPPKGLPERIMSRINTEEKSLVRIRAWVFGSSSIASFGLSLWAVIYLVKNVNESGFWQYLSLAFSDGTALAYWHELSFSLAESLPITSSIVFLAAIGFFIWSFTKMLANIPANTRFGLTA
jgi:hypothetical protein